VEDERQKEFDRTEETNGEIYNKNERQKERKSGKRLRYKRGGCGGSEEKQRKETFAAALFLFVSVVMAVALLKLG